MKIGGWSLRYSTFLCTMWKQIIWLLLQHQNVILVHLPICQCIQHFHWLKTGIIYTAAKNVYKLSIVDAIFVHDPFPSHYWLYPSPCTDVTNGWSINDFAVILNLLTYCTAGMQQLIWWVLWWFGFQHRKIHLQEQVLHNALPVAYLQLTTQHVNSSSGFVKLNGNWR